LKPVWRVSPVNTGCQSPGPRSAGLGYNGTSAVAALTESPTPSSEEAVSFHRARVIMDPAMHQLRSKEMYRRYMAGACRSGKAMTCAPVSFGKTDASSNSKCNITPSQRARLTGFEEDATHIDPIPT
jgi:hypothetical protein